MAFSWTEITNALTGKPRGSEATVGGAQFPGFGTDAEKIARLELAMISISGAITALAKQVEVVSRQIDQAVQGNRIG